MHLYISMYDLYPIYSNFQFMYYTTCRDNNALARILYFTSPVHYGMEVEYEEGIGIRYSY